jgi:hypothetical protein
VSLGIQRGFAVAADPDHPAEVVSAIRMLAADPNHLRAMGQAARAAAPEYDRVKELQKFVKIIEHVKNDSNLTEATKA